MIGWRSSRRHCGRWRTCRSRRLPGRWILFRGKLFESICLVDGASMALYSIGRRWRVDGARPVCELPAIHSYAGGRETWDVHEDEQRRPYRAPSTTSTTPLWPHLVCPYSLRNSFPRARNSVNATSLLDLQRPRARGATRCRERNAVSTAISAGRRGAPPAPTTPKRCATAVTKANAPAFPLTPGA